MPSEPESNQSSEITGAVSVGSVAVNSIGLPRGETGSVAKREASRALAMLDPEEARERVAASLQRISGQRPVFRSRMMFPTDGPSYRLPEAVSWSCASEDQRLGALEVVEHSLRPAPEEALAAALYTLRILTRGRERGSDDDREAEAVIWLGMLNRYPADIALATLRGWTAQNGGQWWPTWHEVEALLDAATAERRLLLAHIQTGGCLTAIPGPKPDHAAISAGVERLRAEMQERHGHQAGRETPEQALERLKGRGVDGLTLSPEAAAKFKAAQSEQAA